MVDSKMLYNYFNLFQYASLGLVVEVSHKFVIIIWIGIFPVH